MKLKNFFLSCLFFCITPLFAKTQIIAAENNYGVIAKMIGGDAVSVTSIMNSPNQDPHLFSVNVQTHALLDTLTAHDMVIINGAGYDAWAKGLLQNTKATVIDVGVLNHVQADANPHLWYDLDKVNVLAKKLSEQLSVDDPNNKKLFVKNLENFLSRSEGIKNNIRSLHQSLHGCPVIATEPVANYLADQLGLEMHAIHFQLSIMNDVEPSAGDRANFLRELSDHKVALLIYNQQVTNPVTTEMRMAAISAGIPVVGVNELLPVDMEDFLGAYQSTLNQFKQALGIKNAKTHYCL